MALNRTQIEWVKNPDGTQGYTWNPITGCLNHVNGMCKGGNFPCYAHRLATTRLRERYLANTNYIGQDTGLSLDDVNNLAGIVDPSDDPFYPRFWPERIPTSFDHWYKQKPRGIFLCDMGELFGDWIPEQWQKYIFNVIKSCPQHRFYLLTKQPQNLIKWSPFPENCYVGVSVTRNNQLADALKYLKQIQAKVKFISFEPLLHWWDSASSEMVAKSLRIAGINWLIIGAQTRPTIFPKIGWVEEIVRAADKAGVLVFLKDNILKGMDLPMSVKCRPLLHGAYKLRQEMPC